jgi:hypothetical protein
VDQWVIKIINTLEMAVHMALGVHQWRCSKGLITLERVGLSPKAQVVPRLEDEGHWKRGTFPKTRKLEMGCDSNFRCKLKKKGHGSLSKWADFFKWSYSYGLFTL